MEVIFIVLPIAIAMAGIFLAAFFWSAYAASSTIWTHPPTEPSSTTPSVYHDGAPAARDRLRLMLLRETPNSFRVFGGSSQYG